LRAFAHPDRQESCPFDVDFFGRRYSGDLADFVDWTVFFYGSYSRLELLALAALAEDLRGAGKPVNFFDVGANVGQHSLFMADRADRVFSFEPFAAVRGEMNRKLKHAGVENVTVFPVALGDRNSTSAFHTSTTANRGMGTLRDFIPRAGNSFYETTTVDVVRGDEFFSANDLPPISLLKIDVEGYESKVLEGLQQTLRRDRPPFLMEISGPDKSGFQTFDGLESRLYRDYLIFEIDARFGRLVLKPLSFERGGETLVLPAELAGFAERFR
jgi:FkbM family methyltransferase